MFTGIIESVGRVVSRKKEGTNITFEIASDISGELKVDQSVSHNGVCLTVVEAVPGKHMVTAIHETLEKSSLGQLADEGHLNLERAMLNNGRFDGHIVQGHVDGLVTVRSIREEDGSWVFVFEKDMADDGLIVEKGSVCLNGVSLTCFDVGASTFTVAIIPYTYEHTSFNSLSEGDVVNIEYDILGKYIQRLLVQRNS